MSKTSISLAITAAALLTTAACDRNSGDDTEAITGGQLGEPAEQTKQDKKAGEPGMDEEVRPEPGAQQGTQPQPGAEKQPGEQPLPAATQERIEDLQDRYDKLEDKASKLQAQTQPGEAEPELDAEIQQAKMLVKAKLEAARNATPANATSMVNEAEEALEEFKQTLDKYKDKKPTP